MCHIYIYRGAETTDRTVHENGRSQQDAPSGSQRAKMNAPQSTGSNGKANATKQMS